ncbi:MAG: DUF378 domain-containing protein [Candidatus Pacebacteria bacterium]|nr:DUF378 domain-containing protein [Candidatus Paceibacterota bacterium]
MGKLNVLDWAALILTIIGGLNWGLNPMGINLVTMILGEGMWANIVYYLVGLSAVYLLIISSKLRK